MAITRIEIVTPEIAAKYLDGMERNRLVTKTHVEFLAKQMRDGKWVDNGDTIKVTKGGRLIDGQHRMLAIVKSQTTQRMTIAVVEDFFAAMPTIDTGRSRRASDVLSIFGVESAKRLSTAAICVIRLKSKMAIDGSWMGGSKTPRKISNEEVLAEIETNDLLVKCFKQIKYQGRSMAIPLGISVATCWYISQCNDDGHAAFFINSINSELGLEQSSPIFHTRKKCKDMRGKMGKHKIFITAVIGWNKYCDGAIYTRSGFLVPSDEPFPAPSVFPRDQDMVKEW